MIKNIVAVLVVVIALTGLAAYGYWQSGGVAEAPIGPRAVITPATYNLGTVIYGEVASHTFRVTNAGDQPLEIRKLSTSCGCTQATMAAADKVIAPGNGADLLVTFDPAVHQDDTDLGELTRIIYLNTNDPVNPEQTAKITANVIKNN